jgi:hypothetical protein
MKIFPFLIVLILAGCINKKLHLSDTSIRYNSLSQYARVVLLLKNSKPVASGTGFFLKYKNRIYFITNYHVATGYNAFNSNQWADTDEILVSMPIDNKFIPIFPQRDFDIERRIHNYDYPDLYIVRLTFKSASDSLAVNFAEISEFVDTSFFNTTPNKVLMLGFPDESIDTNFVGHTNFVTTYLINNPDTLKGGFTTDASDDFKEIMIAKSTQINMLVGNTGIKGGMSGGPVFGEFKTKRKFIYRFLGVTFGGNTQIKVGKIIKARSLINFVDSIYRLE